MPLLQPRNDNRDIVGAMAMHLRAGGVDLNDDTATTRWLMSGRFTALEVCAFADRACQLAREQRVGAVMGVA